jgi:hypothetical protein
MSEDRMDEAFKNGGDHAWNWFALHAGQRMQTFNFFLVATGFLVAAYGSLLDEHRGGAIVVALLEAWLAMWFSRLDARTRQLVKAAERALAVSEALLAKTSSTPEFRIVEAVEQPEPGASSYGSVIKTVQWTIFWVSLGGAGYAAWLVAH